MLLASGAAGALAVLLSAAQAEPLAACQGAETPVQAIDCLSAEQKRQDAQLNAVYERLMLARSADARRELRHRQRAWIRAKEAVCASAVADAGSGPETGVVSARCYLEQTVARLAYLQSLAD